MNRILVVEDDGNIAKNLSFLLTQEGYSVMRADGQKAAVELLESRRYDLILLDISLPDGSGYTVCTAAKRLGDTPVIFLTASDDEISVVTGLDLGADDYITKPFRPMELLSRVKSVLRRAGKSESVFELNNIKIDTVRGVVTKNGTEVFLSALEYRLLLVFANHRGVILSRERLLSEIQKMTVRLREQADALTKDKTFLADSLVDIAHQLRTPMTSLHMLASFLAKPDLDVEQRRPFSHELESLLSRMDWLLSALLKISKIDAGTAVFQRDEISISVLLKKAAQPLEIPLELRGIALRVRCEPSNSITGDLNWTAEALGNILKNCMEHTGQDGTIEIDCTQNAVYTEIAIKDSGAGIAPEDLPHIFKRFYQGKHHKDGSFGVGLALSRMILSAQSATVKAANRSEGGACFTVRFYCA